MSRFLKNDENLTPDLTNVNISGENKIISIIDNQYIDKSTNKIKSSLINGSFQIVHVYSVSNSAERLALSAVMGDYCIQTDTQQQYIYDGSIWLEVDPVDTLSLLSDVNINSGTLVNYQNLTFSTITNKWVNKTPTLLRLGDVSIINPQNNDILIYDQTEQYWYNGTNTLNNLSDVNINPVDGDLLKYNGSQWINYSSSNFATSLALSDHVDNNSIHRSLPAPSVNNYFLGVSDNSYSLISLSTSNLNDFYLSSPSDGQILQYNGTHWVNTFQRRKFEQITASRSAVASDAGKILYNDIPNTSWYLAFIIGTFQTGDEIYIHCKYGATLQIVGDSIFFANGVYRSINVTRSCKMICLGANFWSFYDDSKDSDTTNGIISLSALGGYAANYTSSVHSRLIDNGTKILLSYHDSTFRHYQIFDLSNGLQVVNGMFAQGYVSTNILSCGQYLYSADIIGSATMRARFTNNNYTSVTIYDITAGCSLMGENVLYCTVSDRVIYSYWDGTNLVCLRIVKDFSVTPSYIIFSTMSNVNFLCHGFHEGRYVQMAKNTSNLTQCKVDSTINGACGSGTSLPVFNATLGTNLIYCEQTSRNDKFLFGSYTPTTAIIDVYAINQNFTGFIKLYSFGLANELYKYQMYQHMNKLYIYGNTHTLPNLHVCNIIICSLDTGEYKTLINKTGELGVVGDNSADLPIFSLCHNYLQPPAIVKLNTLGYSMIPTVIKNINIDV